MMIKIAVLISCLVLAGCATPQRATSEKIGCPADETRILETDPGFGTAQTTWRAACGNQQYTCTTGPYAGKSDWLKELSCTPAAKGPDGGYLSKDDLQHEKKQSFDKFLQDLSEPESSTQ